MNQKPGRTKRFLGKLALVLIGFLFGAGIAEIALRIIGYSYPEFYQLDQVRGYALRPRAEGWYRKEGEAYIRINSDGLRDREHEISKPSDTIRIAVLGDSYPEALAVTQEEAFWSVMERKIQECSTAGKKFEVLNFGVSGYGTAQELLTLREEVWKYSPDVVLLAITTNNDIVDNSRDLKKTDGIPYFVHTNNRLTLDDSFKTSRAFLWRQSSISGFGRWLRNHSRFVQALIQIHHALKIQSASGRARGSTPEQPTLNEQGQTAQQQDQPSRLEEPGIDKLIYLEPSDPVWNEAWLVTEGLILEMRNEVRAHGAQFVVVTLSNGPQVLPRPHVREEFEKRFGITDIFYPDNRINSLCNREGIAVITLAPELRKTAEETQTFLHGFGEDIGNGHWNGAGHRAAGELIAKKLCEKVLPK